MQRRQAAAQSNGQLRSAAERWREAVIELRADLEARLDFSDESDVLDAPGESFLARVEILRRDLQNTLDGYEQGRLVRDGFRVAIIGPVNAGKSSLLNALAKSDAAIVTDEPGTTRDVLEVSLDIGGYPLIIHDTAGLREAQSAAEREGIRRAKVIAQDADLVLWVQNAEDDSVPEIPVSCERVVRISSKSDLAGATSEGLRVSVVSGEGLEELGVLLRQQIGDLHLHPAIITRTRHRDIVGLVGSCLDDISSKPPEIAADLLRQSGEAIGRLSGRCDIEDVLDRVFREFCIGK